LRDNNNTAIMHALRRPDSHPDCRCLPILIAALHGPAERIGMLACPRVGLDVEYGK
jgi:hypothetical protein